MHRTSSWHAPRGLSDHAGATGHFRVRLGQAGRWALLLLLRCYMLFLSPFFGGTCKFYPSCSNYAWEAISRHGARRGVALALKRLLRCHPFTKGGVDLVPDELQGLKPQYDKRRITAGLKPRPSSNDSLEASMNAASNRRGPFVRLGRTQGEPQ